MHGCRGAGKIKKGGILGGSGEASGKSKYVFGKLLIE